MLRIIIVDRRRRVIAIGIGKVLVVTQLFECDRLLNGGNTHKYTHTHIYVHTYIHMYAPCYCFVLWRLFFREELSTSATFL